MKARKHTVLDIVMEIVILLLLLLLFCLTPDVSIDGLVTPEHQATTYISQPWVSGVLLKIFAVPNKQVF